MYSIMPRTHRSTETEMVWPLLLEWNMTSRPSLQLPLAKTRSRGRLRKGWNNFVKQSCQSNFV
jgi:hypothetical protein